MTNSVCTLPYQFHWPQFNWTIPFRSITELAAESRPTKTTTTSVHSSRWLAKKRSKSEIESVKIQRRRRGRSRPPPGRGGMGGDGKRCEEGKVLARTTTMHCLYAMNLMIMITIWVKLPTVRITCQRKKMSSMPTPTIIIFPIVSMGRRQDKTRPDNETQIVCNNRKGKLISTSFVCVSFPLNF